MRHRNLTSTLTLIVLGLSSTAIAADATLEERVKALEAQLQAAPKSEPAAKPKAVGETGTTADSKNGFTIASDDGKFALKVWGYLQGEGRFFLNDEEVPLTNTLVLRRARIVAEGKVGLFDFRVMPEFGNGQTLLMDAFLATTVRPWLRFQAGRGKVPIGLEFLQSDTVTAFVERAYPSQLVPNRDNGAHISGDIGSGRLSYTIGVYNGAADGVSRDTDLSDDKDGVARLYATPFVGGNELLAGLSLGIAGSYGRDQGTGAAATGLSTYKSSGQATIFTYDAAVVADGARWRIAPQAFYAVGPFSAMAEYTISSTEVTEAGNHDTIANHAWQGTVGWVLTGENASFKGVAPASPLAYDGSGWGAFELAVRVHRLDIDEDSFTGGFANPANSVEQATGYAVGINWYMSRNVKLKLNFEHTTFAGGAAANGDRESENLISTQLQLVY